MDREIFVNQLIRWYSHQKRDLPWRRTNDPYKIWLSEIILQQTRVNQGMPYYLNFVEKYPTVNDLAEAQEQEVLRLWQGLGYYSRARNLHSCAKMVVGEYDGQFPNKFEELLKLKGIGRYTAAAIASMAFNQVNAVVDGNVYRVLSRVFGLFDDIAETKSAKVFEKLANELIPKDQPGEFNQAIMDFGAIQCTPKSPACAICPLSDSCCAFNKGEIEQLPVKTKKVKVKKLFFNYIIFEYNGELLLHERIGNGIWKGLYQFHLEETLKRSSEESVLNSLNSPDRFTLIDVSEEVKHVLTHRQIFARFFRLRVNELNTFANIQKELNLKAYSLEQIQELPKPILIENYLKKAFY
ncbi:A/G-specific adenine glycosylase [uncultured Roseivirga sp.]|uniref:A/G-specific adenine glycosylase n=1 Tax=uncultured Roseivirga sp. TaxID=543088 RepID=UPI000D7A1332|nr:A/G-specific adenine glycosylase [uncultured Roseivirga sp.]PWL30332.1 MAG: A/G-specific adenine glycosylase [Roseivirga sp. XM-24bin3]